MKRPRSVEETYQKKTPLEHILLRPDTYVGSLERTKHDTWVVRPETSSMEARTVEYVPALYKIFDEVLVNAMDHHVRDPTVTQIRVDVDDASGSIRVWNNGHGIPVVVHAEHGIYVPEMIFGHLLTSSNYDDQERKITGGRNGYGAKLTNIFSRSFSIETFDAERELLYSQTFERNMTVIHPPKIRKRKNKHGWTCVTFLPDYPRFGTSGLDDSIRSIFRRRVYDMAGLVGKKCKVFWNGTEVPVRSFAEYVKWFVPETSKVVFDQPHERWEIGVTLSDSQQFEHVSFVNGVHTVRGGTHVQYVVDKIVPHLVKALNKKLRTASVKPAHVRPHLRVFVRCAIENPAFDSQTKETLTTRPSTFGSTFEVSDAFVKRLLSIGLVERIADWISVRSSKELRKTDGTKRTRLTGIAKLDDANWAGTKRSSECMLILTEGLSAKALAVAGLGVVGRDRFGVYPLRGKLLNVRDASASQVANNVEISELKQILGLKHNTNYTDASTLRYGHVVIMTDQDSVTGSTPVLVRLPTGQVDVRAIETIAETDWIGKDGEKQYATSSVQVWTERGWTSVRQIMRHRTTKRVYRVCTPTGTVDVTEDHSLLDDRGARVTPRACSIGQSLLTAFPDAFETHPPMLSDLFAYDHGTRWVLEDDMRTPIPIEMMNATETARRAFVKAVRSAANLRRTGASDDAFTWTNAVEAMKWVYLCRSVGLTVNVDTTMEPTWTIRTIDPSTQCEPTRIRAVFDLGTTERYVYDLETENHHFHAGVGDLIVHNTDGSHIKGLVMNFFHVHFPSLLRVPGFLMQFVTPIVRAKKGSTTHSFYTIPEYERWKRTVQASQWSIKYYKGLGTSTSAEAKEYFSHLPYHLKPFVWDGDEIDDKFRLAFSKSRADDRKAWIASHTEDVFLDHSPSEIRYVDFVDRELVLFSVADLRRSVPSLVDGWKPGQRKVLYGAFSRNLRADIKVAQFAGYVSEHAAYHHGEASLHGTIVGMAQTFVGSNNLNVLVPSGQFGTRAHGGVDAASPRYIFTRLEPHARLLFPADDEACLRYLEDDGQRIEPEWYAPIIPTVLINGAEGIGTGWRTYVPNFDPRALIENVRRMLRGERPHPMVPWYRGFKGTIVETEPKKWTSRGTVRKVDETTLEITELPVRVWTHTYKEWLESWIKPADGRPKLVDYKEHHTETTVRFVLTLTPEQMKRACDVGLTSYFRLEHPIPGTQMVLFDAKGLIRKYDSPIDILTEFMEVRRKVYVDRKAHLVRTWEDKCELLDTKARFIAWVLDGSLDVRKQSRNELDRWLERQRIPRRSNGYDYLWNLPMHAMTRDRIDDLRAQIRDAQQTLDRFRSETIEHMWMRDLRALEQTIPS